MCINSLFTTLVQVEWQIWLDTIRTLFEISLFEMFVIIWNAVTLMVKKSYDQLYKQARNDRLISDGDALKLIIDTILIVIFKCRVPCTNLNEIRQEYIFHRDTGVRRGHSEKLHKHTFNLDVQKFSFSQRVINHWNALTQHAVDCFTVNSFKRCVDHYIRDKGYL